MTLSKKSFPFKSVLPNMFRHFPAECSSMELKHFGQEYKCQYFGKMKEGSELGCHGPLPRFYVGNVQTAVSLFWSPADTHSLDGVNIEVLKSKLTNVKGLVDYECTEYNHVGFIWGEAALIERGELFAPHTLSNSAPGKFSIFFLNKN